MGPYSVASPRTRRPRVGVEIQRERLVHDLHRGHPVVERVPEAHPAHAADAQPGEHAELTDLGRVLRARAFRGDPSLTSGLRLRRPPVRSTPTPPLVGSRA